MGSIEASLERRRARIGRIWALTALLDVPAVGFRNFREHEILKEFQAF
jgi:hypothetical protein